MQHVSSLGGPRVLLPTVDTQKWIDELGDTVNPDEGLYGLACSLDAYCGVIAPWGTPLLVFGDDPADIYFAPDQFDGLFFRWIGAYSIEQLTAFAIDTSRADSWDETTDFRVFDSDMTLMDTCTFDGDIAPRIPVRLRLGSYTIQSRYAEGPGVMTVVHRFQYVG